MPALIESSGENRRPRRSSITQSLQRMFHLDKAGDTRKNSSYEDPFNADVVTSTTYQPNPSVRRVGDNGSLDHANYGPSEISSIGYSRHSYSSMNSKTTGLNTSESRHSSLRSFHLEPQPPAKDSPIVDDDGPLHRQDTDRTLTASHSIVQKKDRRATKRLEAERLELERRLLKLEKAERTGDASVLRRESRRLTKKQPLGSSSRSSSVSGDESRSRPSSRLSSIFSSSRRRSRSRSSSIDGFDNAQFTGRGEAPSNDNPNILPALSSTLPERLSTAISKELAERKDALLASPEPSSQPLKLLQLKTTAESTDGLTSQPTTRDEEEVTYAVGAIPSEGIHQVKHLELATPDTKDTNKPTDLDRALFTASLTSKQRNLAPSESGNTKAVPTTYRNVESESETQPPAEDHIETNSKYRSTESQRGVSSRSLLARVSTDGVVLKNQKFKSSPLAKSQTISGDDDVPFAPKRAATLASLQASDTARPQTSTTAEKATRSGLSVTSSPSVLQRSNGNVPDNRTTINTHPSITVNPSVTEARNARTFVSRIPTSKPSQLAPSALLTKPRFYNSLNKVTGPSGDKPKAIDTLSPPRQERVFSPTVPPKSPKRSSRTLSQSPDKLDSRPRPTSSLSIGMSQGSESDYNTADETASIISRVSDDSDLPAAANVRPVDGTHTVSKKGVLSLDSASIPGASASNEDSKKAAQKTRQSGRDQLVAKLFVICCRCKFWHDMPSEVYASLTLSDPLSAALDQELAAWEQKALSDRLSASTARAHPLRGSPAKLPKSEIRQRSLRTRVTTDLPSGPVKCSWCEHHMSKQCCQGWSTVVQMHQRYH